MDPDFWHTRWQANQIGFHQGEINPYLQRYWHTPGLAAGARILVPLCGKSLDMLWLRRQGYTVAGIEISPLAVEAFFADNGLEPERAEYAGYSVYSHRGIEIHCADFFNLGNAEIGEVHGFYDRAALIAMNEAQRPRYADHLAGLLPGGAPGLLVTLDYEPGEMDGPPFAVTPDEVSRLFGRAFRVEHLQAVDALDENPAFRERGLSRMAEHVFRLGRV